MVIWKFSPIEPTWEELKASIIDTSHEKVRVCTFQLPKNINNKTFAVSEVGVPLILSPLIEEGRYEEAAEAARVNSILQSVVSKKIFYFFFLQTHFKVIFSSILSDKLLWIFDSKWDSQKQFVLLVFSGGKSGLASTISRMATGRSRLAFFVWPF